MSADKTIGDEEKTGRRRRSVLARNRSEEPEEEQEEALEERGVTVGKGRATPSRRRQEDEEEKSSNLATRTVGGLRGYIEGVRSELEKVVWPTREETRRLTIIVMVTLIASALALGAISFIFTELFRIGLANPIILIGVMLIAVAGGLIVYRYNGRRASY